MKCPACETPMKEVPAGEVQVDICCDGCGGIWFDAKELQRFDDGEEFNPESLVTTRITRTDIDQKAIRHCPRCPREVLVRQFADRNNKVEINQCWSCGGVFLDIGELAALRSEFANNEERRAAINTYVQQCVSTIDTRLSQETQDWQKAQAQKNANPLKSALNALKDLLLG